MTGVGAPRRRIEPASEVNVAFRWPSMITSGIGGAAPSRVPALRASSPIQAGASAMPSSGSRSQRYRRPLQCSEGGATR